MNLERVGLGVAVLLCLGLAGWNVQLRRELDTLRARGPEVSAEPARPSEGRAETPRARTRQQLGSTPDRQGAPEDTPDRPNAPVEVGASGGNAGRGEPTQQDWEAMRAQMETSTVDVVEAMAEQRGWTAETTEEVLGILLESGDAIGALWGQVHEGELTHYQARKQMGALRDAAGEEVVALIGEAAHEELEEHLWEARREMWQRGHQGEATGNSSGGR